MENVKKSEMINFREEIKDKLNSPDLFIYNPVDQGLLGQLKKTGEDEAVTASLSANATR